MNNWDIANIQVCDKVTERKIRYDTTTEEHSCILLEAKSQNIVLFHKIAASFAMITNQNKLTIPKGSYTLAYYWKNRPFNLYIWRDKNGNYLGSYFNIVKNTCLADNLLSFEDLIIDVLVFPNGHYFILDEDELSEPLAQFENGFVQQALHSLIDMIDLLLPQTISEAEKNFKHEKILPLLQIAEQG
ncbi:DUF402 domain-containing protein [Pueribacillus theae]|uniref:DUF402 domain-containing protein n=1 Tax=Pueribacillus theae TaxID=2171751 RepID=A0A2U1JV95_9BACI|nr:DUF402 domain-containing protein [Pueribacillus theae]PWA08879.1 DUF402 domain-containing protein [Pueribacillus theae]